MKIMGRHKLKCQLFGTQITQCGAQINTVRHQSANIRNEKEKLPQRKRGRRRVPRAGSCAIASLQRGKDFPVASKARSENRAVSGQEDGKYRGEGRECNQAHRKKEVKTVQSFTPSGGKKQWCLGRSEHFAPSCV